MPTTVPEDRLMTSQESAFVRWLLIHGDDRAKTFLPQTDRTRVVGRCGCGCASINFAVDGKTFYGKRIDGEVVGMETLVEYQWTTIDGKRFAVFVFACNGLLAGLDLWSMDGQGIATELPATSVLRAFVE